MTYIISYDIYLYIVHMFIYIYIRHYMYTSYVHVCVEPPFVWQETGRLCRSFQESMGKMRVNHEMFRQIHALQWLIYGAM